MKKKHVKIRLDSQLVKFIVPEIPKFKLPKVKVEESFAIDPEYKKWIKKIKLKERLVKSTLVIGARGKDGIVIGADRKVVRGESSSFEDKIKVFKVKVGEEESGSIIFSATGYTGIWEDFLEDFISSLKENIEESNIRNLKDVKMFAEVSLEQIYLHYLPSLGKGFINFVLGGLREITKGDALLYNLMPVEPEYMPRDRVPPAYGERITNVIILGHGTPYAKTITRFLLKEEKVNSLDIKELAERIYVCIKWVASHGIDEYVGGEPQILGLEDNIPSLINFEEKLDKNRINEKIEEIQKILSEWKF